MKKMRITRISTSENPKFRGHVPDNFTYAGYVINEPKIGERFELGDYHTSIVQKINGDGTFETMNSIYKLEDA